MTEHTLDQQWRDRLIAEIDGCEAKFQRATSRWSFWYYLSLFAGVLLPVLAAFVMQLERLDLVTDRETLAGVLAVLGAVATAALGAGKFHARWAAARRARMTMHSLRIEAFRPDVDPAKLTERLQAAIARYHEDVVGDGTRHDGVPTQKPA